MAQARKAFFSYRWQIAAEVQDNTEPQYTSEPPAVEDADAGETPEVISSQVHILIMKTKLSQSVLDHCDLWCLCFLHGTQGLLHFTHFHTYPRMPSGCVFENLTLCAFPLTVKLFGFCRDASARRLITSLARAVGSRSKSFASLHSALNGVAWRSSLIACCPPWFSSADSKQ